MYNSAIDLATLLGERTLSGGQVTAASAALMTFLLRGTDDVRFHFHFNEKLQ
jgi:hypothetical protein